MNLMTRNMCIRNLNKFYSINVIPEWFRLSRLQYYTCVCASGNLNVKNKNINKLKTSLAHIQPIRRDFNLVDVKRNLRAVFRKIFFLENSAKVALGLLMLRSLDKLKYEEFNTYLQMPDTFYSWFKITELHVWMLLVRLMKDEDHYRTVRNALIDALWIDVEKRSKMVDPMNKNYKNDIKNLYNKFKMSILAYDEGHLGDDITLASALWYQFFDKNCDDPRQIEALVSYIRYQINYLDYLVPEKINLDKNLWTSFLPHTRNLKQL